MAQAMTQAMAQAMAGGRRAPCQIWRVTRVYESVVEASLHLERRRRVYQGRAQGEAFSEVGMELFHQLSGHSALVS